MRPQRKDHHQQGKGDDVFVVGGNVIGTERFGKTDDQTADDGARHAAHATQNNDHEGFGDHQMTHGRIHQINRGVKRGGHRSQGTGDGEGEHGDAVGIDANQRSAIAVLRHGDDGRPGHGAGKEDLQHGHQREGPGNDHQALHRRRDPGDFHNAAEGCGHAQEVGTPQGLGTRLQKQQQANGGDHGVKARMVTQRAKHQALGQRTDHSDHAGGTDHGDPVVHLPAGHELKRHKGTHHVKRTVGEIGHMQNAVDQGQTQCHQTVNTTQRQAVEQLLKKNIHCRCASQRVAGRVCVPLSRITIGNIDCTVELISGG